VIEPDAADFWKVAALFRRTKGWTPSGALYSFSRTVNDGHRAWEVLHSIWVKPERFPKAGPRHCEMRATLMLSLPSKRRSSSVSPTTSLTKQLEKLKYRGDWKRFSVNGFVNLSKELHSAAAVIREYGFWRRIMTRSVRTSAVDDPRRDGDGVTVRRTTFAGRVRSNLTVRSATPRA
jgi:hypothetical protein